MGPKISNHVNLVVVVSKPQMCRQFKFSYCNQQKHLCFLLPYQSLLLLPNLANSKLHTSIKKKKLKNLNQSHQSIDRINLI
jgi:hypothetical protein